MGLSWREIRNNTHDRFQRKNYDRVTEDMKYPHRRINTATLISPDHRTRFVIIRPIYRTKGRSSMKDARVLNTVEQTQPRSGNHIIQTRQKLILKSRLEKRNTRTRLGITERRRESRGLRTFRLTPNSKHESLQGLLGEYDIVNTPHSMNV